MPASRQHSFIHSIPPKHSKSEHFFPSVYKIGLWIANERAVIQFSSVIQPKDSFCAHTHAEWEKCECPVYLLFHMTTHAHTKPKSLGSAHQVFCCAYAYFLYLCCFESVEWLSSHATGHTRLKTGKSYTTKPHTGWKMPTPTYGCRKRIYMAITHLVSGRERARARMHAR